MEDKEKNQKQLLEEIKLLKARIGELEKLDVARKKAEEMLLVSEENYRQIFEHSNDAIFIADPKTRMLIHCNRKAQELTGYSKDELLSMRGDQLHPEDRVKKTMEEFEKQAEGMRFSVESEILTKDKERICVSINSAVVQINGQPKLVGAFRDISQSKKTGEELKDSERKYRTLVESASDQIFMVDKEYKLVSANTTVLRLFGKKQDEIIGKNISEIFPKEIAEKNLKSLEKVLKTGESVFVEDKMIVGEHEFWSNTSLNPVKNDSDETIAVLGITRDITKRKEAEEKVKLFSQAIENAFDSFILTDMNGNITYANKSATKSFGYAPDEAIGLNVSQLTENPEDAKKIIEGIKKEGSWSGEVMQIRKDKKKFPTILTTSLVQDDQGYPKVMLGIFRDITKSKKAEEELKKKISDLERFQRITVDRELKMIELKKKITALEAKLAEKL